MKPKLFEDISVKIHILRETQVIIDADIAELYQVDTAYLKRQVKRHIERFDEEDFMFQLAEEELEYLRCQIGTAKFAKTRSLPFAFTEQGVYMLATVLNSPIAVDISKEIMRTFAKLRKLSIEHRDLAEQIGQLRKEIADQKTWTKERLTAVADAIIMLEDLMEEKNTDIKKIGFL